MTDENKVEKRCENCGMASWGSSGDGYHEPYDIDMDCLCEDIIDMENWNCEYGFSVDCPKWVKQTCLNCKFTELCERNYPANFVECMRKEGACDEWQARKQSKK